ncbi:MAG: xanthine dehydrogenase family protein molybdopterin-binding subunit [Dehalococcoidia bacterium]|nr:xanthine dehydrogenase family protein molybdopterin-binding subunit [Dehalococcoidia bacterium]
MSDYTYIGKRLPSLESVPKGTGESKYADDLRMPAMLYARTLRSPFPHARIVKIDTSRARALPGVEAVITVADTPGRKYGYWPPGVRWDQWSNIIEDRYPLAKDKVRFAGEELAAVAAVDEDTAEEAIRLIDVEYAILPAVFEAEEAIKPGAPSIHDAENNICTTVTMRAGDAEAGLAQADHVRQDRFSFSSISHSSIEPHSALAYYDPTGNLTVWTATQMIGCSRSVLAHLMALPEDRVRYIVPVIGGAFGGKSSIFPYEFCAALLSQKTGKPVKITYSREEVFTSTIRRYNVVINLKTGFKRDGTITAVQARVLADAGAYVGLGTPPLVNGAIFLTAPYNVPNLSYEGSKVYTNLPVSGPMRGPGLPQTRYAVETQLDLAARDLGIDPVELRRRNSLKSGDRTVLKWDITSCGLQECLDTAEKSFAGDRKGVGLAASSFMSGYDYPARHLNPASVSIEPDGTVNLQSICSDFGQGGETAMRQIVAESLGVAPESVRMRSGDSALFPTQWWAFSDTASTGRSMLDAAAQARQELLEVVADNLEAKAGDLECKGGRIYVKGSPERGVSFTDAARKSFDRRTRAAWGESRFCSKDELRRIGQRGPFLSCTFSAQSARAEVDRETGLVDITRMVTAYDCGQPINLHVVEGTLQGGSTMGLGLALLEGVIWRDGQPLNPSFLDYKLATALDTPSVETLLIETEDPGGPYGAKEVGQGSLQAAAPAVGNAIFADIGVAMTDLPITPEKVLMALEGKA